MGGAGLSTLTGGLAYAGTAVGTACLATDKVMSKSGKQSQGCENNSGNTQHDGGVDEPGLKENTNMTDSRLVIWNLQKGDKKSKQQLESEAGGELRFRSQTKFGSMVDFYVVGTGGSV
ncbi:predicted protein [Uncinocarpus reesii 1704]|uniref:Uncharacterized protein n=1 Tax=Uncinocarpus reesii (strain UAMH 1704) TaxID=336963 RepID=C4JLI6_UNCRE|nr:uncharacterized protein UREG_03694 [Uncinocarpus reesii 1704]EEP78848.1 predicted protein [Uncinocarpus reesii 1704]